MFHFLLFIFSIVLSVQGWQTFTGLVVYKLLNLLYRSSFPLTGLDRAAIISLLPGLLFHTTALIANSKVSTLKQGLGSDTFLSISSINIQ